ncbi:MAG: LysR family transcriptional regulator [bacterium]|nr:LysR family transcriptional regulator [bacterium]
MDLYYLEYIVAIADKGSISKAAESLHISQPTLSIYLSKLEKQMNIKLFTRSNNVLTITEAGKKYVSTCKEILKLRDRLYRDLYPQDQNLIRIGVLSSSAPIFKRVMQEFKAQYPYATLRPLMKKSEGIYNALLAGDVDMGFVTSYAEKPETLFPEAKCHILQEYELVLCMARRNPLYKKLHLEDGTLKEDEYRLLQSGRITISDMPMIRQRIVEKILPFMGVEPAGYVAVDDNLEFFTSTLYLEDLYCFIPYSHLPEEMVQIALPFHPKVTKLAICRKGSHLNELQKEFMERICEAFHETTYYYFL